jgi:NLR family CARD domain-containing protein 3
MEVFVRIAEEKYIKSGVATTFLESMKFIWDDHLKEEFTRYSS